MAVRERGPEDIQKVVWGEVRCRWGRVDVAEVMGLVDDVGVGGGAIIEVEVEVDVMLTLTCSLDKVSCFFDDCFSLSAGPRYC